MLEPGARRRLSAALRRSRELGLLGAGPVELHLDHALELSGLLGEPPGRFLDLGAGGGIPGLVLATAWPGAEAVLLDAHRRSIARLRAAAEELELSARVQVLEGRAEELGREPELRASFDLVVARGFGPPAVTAECGAPFLRVGGRLVVTEPPGDPSPARWPVVGLAELGLSEAHRLQGSAMGAVVSTRTLPVADRWPRRTGVPRKRPVWRVPPAG